MKRAVNRSDWKDGFVFVGNELALDFVNTRPVLDGEATELLKDFASVLRWFVAAGLLDSAKAGALERQWRGTAKAERATEVIKNLRERLREEIVAWEEGRAIRNSTINELNGLMEAFPMRTRIVRKAGKLSTLLWFEARDPEDLLAPLSHSATALFAGGDRGRVRKCANCVLHFRDTSKKGTRRWCSMQLCGNRFKVAAYAARQRSGMG